MKYSVFRKQQIVRCASKAGTNAGKIVKAWAVKGFMAVLKSHFIVESQ